MNDHICGNVYALWKIITRGKKHYYEDKKLFDKWYKKHKTYVDNFKNKNGPGLGFSAYQFTPNGWVKV